MPTQTITVTGSKSGPVTASLVINTTTGNQYYVSPSGSDANPGTSVAPFLTLQKGASVLKPGDTLNVLAGTYAGFVCGWDTSGLFGPINGTAAAPITIQANPGVVINTRNANTFDGIDFEGCGNYLTLKGFSVLNPSGGSITRGGIRFVNNSGGPNLTNVSILNCTVDNSGQWNIFTSSTDNLLIQGNTASNAQNQHGIYVSNHCVNPKILNNVCHDNKNCGIELNGDIDTNGGDGLIHNALIANNNLYMNGGTGGSAINLDCVRDSLVQNNLIWNSGVKVGGGIALFNDTSLTGPASTGNVIVNNTLSMGPNARFGIQLVSQSINNVVFNNICLNSHVGGSAVCLDADASSLTGLVSDYNIFYPDRMSRDNNTVITLAQWQSATGQDKHSFETNPTALFVNPASDFHLLSTSPAINKGIGVLGGKNAPTLDLEGKTRPLGSTWDIGCYEAA